MKILIPLASVMILLMIFSCKHATIIQYDCTGMTPGYTADIKPILDASCATSDCHSGSKPSAGIGLADYTDAAASSTNKNFLGAVQQLSGYTKMPKGADKLSDSQIKLITCWVQSGSPK